MPVTRTAKRALRSSKRKQVINKRILSQLEIAIRLAKKQKENSLIKKAISLADRASKKGVIHKRKVSRIKSKLSKLLETRKIKTKSKNP